MKLQNGLPCGSQLTQNRFEPSELLVEDYNFLLKLQQVIFDFGQGAGMIRGLEIPGYSHPVLQHLPPVPSGAHLCLARNAPIAGSAPSGGLSSTAETPTALSGRTAAS